MPYQRSMMSKLVEATEKHDGLVAAALADGHVDATEASRILTSSRALVAMAVWVAAVLRVVAWIAHAGRPPRDFLREHPGWAWDDADLPPAA